MTNVNIRSKLMEVVQRAQDEKPDTVRLLRAVAELVMMERERCWIIASWKSRAHEHIVKLIQSGVDLCYHCGGSGQEPTSDGGDRCLACGGCGMHDEVDPMKGLRVASELTKDRK